MEIADRAAFVDEDRRVRLVQTIVSFTASVIMQGHLCRTEGEFMVATARERILELFPGREETYDLLYSRRFSRLLDEFTRPDPPGSLLIH
jgi:hypothetical protein